MKNTILYAVRTGLEPVTPCVTGMYSNQAELTHQYFNERQTRLDAFCTLSSFLLFERQTRLDAFCTLSSFLLFERQTRLELATPTLARSCSTN